MDHSEFETKSILRHGHKYDYSRVQIINNRIKVEIVCQKHGPFLQAPDHHIRGRGCPTCAKESRVWSRPLTSDEFFIKATEIHKGFYNYSSSVFLGGSKKISIVCTIHGEFSTLARKHLHEKRGCPSCGKVKTRYSQSVMYQDFFDRAVDRHGLAYSYAETSLRFLSDDIDVVCPAHGPFTVVASDHVHGRGCPKCRPQGSTPENELADYIHNLGFDIVRNSRKIIPPLELDVAIPSERIAFEFNGIFWHSEQAGKAFQYHQNKTLMAQSSGYKLFHVYESDWDINRGDVEERIRRILSRTECPDLSGAYPIEEHCGDYKLILRGNPIAGFRVKDCIARDSWSMYGLEATKLLMTSSGISKIQTSLDWPEHSLEDFYKFGFRKYMNVRPGRLYFDKKTLRRLKEKPREYPGLEFLSVVDSGAVIWEVVENGVAQNIPEDTCD